MYLDTRFELDIDMSADGDSQSMVYVNGGITSTHAGAPGQVDQKATWDSRIDRPATTTNESHYFDFLVDVPEGGEGDYLGFVAYDRFELHILVDGYELWDMGGTPLLIDSVTTVTKGRRNIGIRAGVDAGVWIDGSLTLGGPTTILPRPQVRFGTHKLDGSDGDPGLVLLENLCYVRSWLRHVSEAESIPTGPRVTTTFFDGPRPVTVREPVTTNTSMVIVNFTEDGTRADHTQHNDSIDTLTLPNGRRTTGQVIRPYADGISYEGGTPIELEEAAPGVAIRIAVDAVGARQNQVQLDPWELKNWPNFGYATTSSDFGALYGVSDIAMGFGPSGGAKGIRFSAITSSPGIAQAAFGTGESADDGAGNAGGTCLCSCQSCNIPSFSLDTTNTSLAVIDDKIGGGLYDPTNGVQFCIFDDIGALGKDLLDKGEAYVDECGRLYRGVRDNGAGYLGDQIKEGAGNLAKQGAEAGLRNSIIAFRQLFGGTYKAELDAIEGMIPYVSEVAQQLGETVAEELWGLLTGLANSVIQGRLMLSQLEGIGQIAEVISSMRTFDADDWRDLVDAIGDEAFKALVGTHLTPEEFIDAATNVNLDCAESRANSAHAHAKIVYGGIVLVAGIVSGGVALVSKIKSFKKFTEKIGGFFRALPGLRKKRKCHKTGDTAGNNRCFVAGTLVYVLKDDVDPERARQALESGQHIEDYFDLIPIEQVQAGDVVLSRDDASADMPLSLGTVSATFSHVAVELVELTLFQPATREVQVIRTTPGHPFWAAVVAGESLPLASPGYSEYTHGRPYQQNSQGEVMRASEGWVYATDLRPGTVLATSCGHGLQVLQTTHTTSPGTKVYNFAVSRTASYHVTGTRAATSRKAGVWTHNQCPEEKRPESGAGDSTDLPGVVLDEKKVGHIFRDSPGHVADTPANRMAITQIANNKKRLLGKDQHGNEWYAKINDDGSQWWVQVRGGKIFNAGRNATPKTFSPLSGLSSPTVPGR